MSEKFDSETDTLKIINFLKDPKSKEIDLALLDNYFYNISTDEMILLSSSKYESESIPDEYRSEILATSTNQTLGLPDIFDDTESITQTATRIFEETGLKFNKEELTSNATVYVSNTGRSFSYSSLLVADTGTTKASIALHPMATGIPGRNSEGKMVDLNLLAWYLIFKILGFNIRISSTDNGLSDSVNSYKYTINHV